MNAKSFKKHEIKREIEDYLRYGIVFDYVLKKNTSLFFDKLENVEYNNYWFEYEEDNICFSEYPKISETFSSHGDLFYSYINDFKFTGKLCYSDHSHNEHKIDISIEATLRIFKSPSNEIDLSDRTNHIEVWDLNQKLINLSFSEANKKLSGLDFIPYDYGLYTQTRSKIDSSSQNYKRQFHVTSYYYLQELIECYERIKHLLSMVLLNDNYSNQYTAKKVDMLANDNSQHIYEIADRFKIYDRYYLMYSELTIESYYKFWERIGFYIFQFLKPVSFKKRKLSLFKFRRDNNGITFYLFQYLKSYKININDKNLSLFKLIKELNKEYSTNLNLQNEHFDWFVNFVLPNKSDYEKLLNYRHPFIHYKVENRTAKGVGSLIATVLNNWTENMFDETKLNLLEMENKKIKEFLLDQFDKCKLGYEHMMELIKLLPDKK